MNFISSIGTAISDAFSSVFNWIWGFIGDEITKVIADLFTGILTGIEGAYASLIKSTLGSVNTIKTYLNINNNAALSEVWTWVGNAYNSIAAIGTGLLILFWLFGIVDKLTKDKLTVHELLRSGLSLVVGFLFVSQGFKMFTGLLNFSGAIFDSVSGYISDTSRTLPTAMPESVWQSFFGNDCKNLQTTVDTLKLSFFPGLIKCAAAALEIGIIYLVSKGSAIFSITIALSRFIQLCIYAVMSPLATADFFNGGIFNSSGVKFLKKFFAVGLQGVVILLVLYITTQLNYSLLKNGGSVALIGALQVVSVSLLMKTQQITNDIVGV